jgi:N-acetylneuraminic acid mutarotase
MKMKMRRTTHNQKLNFNWILTSLMLGGVLGIASVSLGAGDSWTQKADMSKARFILSASAVDGRIYAIGGSSAMHGAGISSVDEYNPTTDTWTTKAPMPTPRQWLSTSVVNGKIYAIGGDARAGAPSLPTVEEYDPATDTWTEKAPMLTARFGHSTSVVDGKIYAMGGWLRPPERVVSDVEEYDPATDTWTQKASMPTARAALSTSVVDGKIYAIGGTTYRAGLSTAEVYDPATDTWTAKASMPTARNPFLSASVVDGMIYVIGGASGETAFSTVEAYDPATNTWTEKTSMPRPRATLATSVVGGKIYALGGTPSGHGAPTSTVYEYDTGLGVPSPDFNGDGIVEIKDLLRMIEAWGLDDPALDIGPGPFGDGVVDAADLEVLMNSWGQEVGDPSLKACWKLDETEGDVAYDSAAVNDAAVMGDALWQADSGMRDGALQFDGVDDCVGTPFVLNPADVEFSIFAWIKGGTPGQVIISQEDGADWLLTNTQGYLMTALKSSGRRSGGPLISETITTDGNWHRVGFVWDGLSRILYVDDVVVAEDTLSSLAGASGGLYIGTSSNLEAGTFWSGLIDDVRIYDRVVIP